MTPEIGTLWVHKSGGRICKVVGLRSAIVNPGPPQQVCVLVEYRYKLTVGGLGRNRSTPMQTMELNEWRRLFTKEAP